MFAKERGEFIHSMSRDTVSKIYDAEVIGVGVGTKKKVEIESKIQVTTYFAFFLGVFCNSERIKCSCSGINTELTCYVLKTKA